MERNNYQEQQLKDTLEKLEQGVESIKDTESFRAFLDFQAKFYRYSPRNTLLIMLQRPDATIVASYGRWQELKRQVMKGERGIRIIAPLIKKVVDEETKEEEKKLVGYKVVSTFDISQTQGEPVPDLEVPVLDGEGGRELYLRLLSVASKEGLVVKRGGPFFDARPNAYGYLERSSKTIAIRDGVSSLQEANTMTHEILHYLGNHDMSDARTETIAQGGAYVVLKHFGLETSDRTFPYLASWLRERDLTKSLLGNIGNLSKELIDRIDPPKQHNKYEIQTDTNN